MLGDYVREQKGNCKTLRATCGVRTRTFLGLPYFSFIFFLLDLSNIEKGGEVASSVWIVALGRALETILAQDW